MLPYCKEFVKQILYNSVVREFSRVSLTNNFITLQIGNMSTSVQKYVAEVYGVTTSFHCKIDESNTISQKCPLLSYIRFVE